MNKKTKVEIFGKFFDNHSFSIINRNLAKELSKLSNIDLSITPVDRFDPKYKVSREDLERIDILKQKRMNMTEFPDVLILHSYPPVWRWPVGKNTKLICYQHWEYSKIPSEWQYKWEQYTDAIACSSSWTRENILNAGINPEKVFKVTPGVNREIFNQEKSDKKEFLNTKKFVFTFVGCSQFRKGVDILLETWGSAFAKADNTMLVIKDNPYVYGESQLLNQIINLQYKSHCAEIRYNDDMLSEKEMAALYKDTDVLVHPYRGEGFGMHVQEAMACGAYPLVTNGGSLNDFVNEKNGLLIASMTKMVDFTHPQIFAIKPGDSLTSMGEHGWIIEPDRNDFNFKLRSLYHQHNIAQMKETTKKVQVTSWEESAKQMLQVIEYVNKLDGKPRRYS